MKYLYYWFMLVFNPWKCHRCGMRGCSQLDYPDGFTLWTGKLCGHEYIEGSGEIFPL